MLLNHKKTLRFLASRGEKFNLGPEMRLDCSELLSNKILLKYKGIKKTSDLGIRWGQKEPLLVLAMELYTLQLVITVNQKNVWRL